jgi:hypothetical protein
MAGLIDRMVRAAKLDPALYEEVESDPGATGQAMTVVVLSSVAAGIGGIGKHGAGGLVGGLILALIGWFVWAGLTYLLGTKLFPGPNTKADLGQLLRTTGFASSPGVIRVLGILPLLGKLISFAAAIWMLVAFVVAVRQALDYEKTSRALLVCFVGWVIYVGIVVWLGAALLGGAAMMTHA